MTNSTPKNTRRKKSEKIEIDYSGLRLPGPNERIGSIEVEGRKIWIKDFSAENISWGRLGHAAISVLSPSSVMKATPVVKPARAKQREINKLRSFQAAGFRSPEILYEEPLRFVMSDEGRTLNEDLATLKTSDAKRHDDLLIGWIEEIGKVHAAGLCHGRPHVKDIIYNGKEWIHLDFEEAPETVMPLETAQARDLLLVFHQLVARMSDQTMLADALDRYRKIAPGSAVIAARNSIETLAPLAKLAEWLCRIKRWKDIDQFVRSIRFLKGNL